MDVGNIEIIDRGLGRQTEGLAGQVEWTPLRRKREESLLFALEESELDQMTAAATKKSRRMSKLLQTPKETFADLSEVVRLRWKDIDFKNGVASINHPVKGHDPRQTKASAKLLGMLIALPRKWDLVFASKYRNTYKYFQRVRKRAAEKPSEPGASEAIYDNLQTLRR